jgi:uncharacterized membrane protein
MESRAILLGHRAHPQLFAPLPGLSLAAVIFVLIHLITGNAQWALLSIWKIAAGVIGAVLTAPFGLVDRLGVDG